MKNSALKNTFDLLENIYASSRSHNGPMPFQFFVSDKAGKKVERVIDKPTEKVALLNMMIQSFLLSPRRKIEGDEEKRIQAFTGSSSIAKFTDAAFSTFVDQRDYDLGWARAFRTVDLLDIGNGRKQLFFNIATGESGATMMKVPEGGKVQFDGFKGTSLQVPIEKYGMGFSVTWEMLNNRDFNAFGDMLNNVASQIYGTWADVHYALLSAAATAAGDVAYDTTGADILEKDTITINKAAVAILEANKDKNSGVTGSTQLLILAPETMRSRINRALRGIITDERRATLEYNVAVEYTLNDNLLAASANKFEVVMGIPGRKTQNAVHTEQLGLTETDIASLSRSETAWTAFGAGIGDNSQWKRVLFHT